MEEKLVIKNVNPKNKRTGDCVVRALTVATSISYEQVVKELVGIWLKTGFPYNDKRNYEVFLKNHNFEKMKQPRKKNGTKYLVGEINELVSKNDIVVISMARHLVCKTAEGIIDIFDPRQKTIGNYYIKQGEKQ